SRDLYLAEVTGDYYWLSEYRYRGQPAKFRCAFIVHLEPAAKTRARVQVIEYLPELWVGKVFGFSAHGGPIPGFYYDIRFVAPTASDRAAILKAIQAAAG